MQTSINEILLTIKPYIIPTLMGIVCLVVGVVCVCLAIRLLIKQVKLHNSISLVSLKHPKVHYWTFMLLLAFCIVYVIMQMLDSRGSEVTRMLQLLSMERWQTNISFGAVLWLLLSVEFLLGVFAYAKCAVVDRGVYAGTKYLDWYHVHDYIIDEDRGLVILSYNKYTFGTLVGTTPPLRVAKNDILKLKFILNRNKNKFSSFDESATQKEETDVLPFLTNNDIISSDNSEER